MCGKSAKGETYENLINGTTVSRNLAILSVEDKSLENKVLKIFNLERFNNF